MDKDLLQTYKFMDTPEFVKKNKKQPAKQQRLAFNWLLNHFINTD